MVNRILLPLLLLFVPVRAQDAADPAAAMPAKTLAYAEFDAGALHEGFLSLDVVKALFAEEFESFFRPLLSTIPVEELKTMKPVRDWVKGKAAVGLTGFSLHLRGLDGSYETVRFAPGGKVDPRLLNLLFRAELTGWGPSILLEPEGVAILEPGESMRAWLDDFLANPPVRFTHKFVQRGARQILTLKFEPFEVEDVWMAPEIHADLTGDRWILATSAELLKHATAAGESLAGDPGFARARARYTSGKRVAFAYVDATRVFALAEPALPAIVKDSMQLNGLSSVRHLAMGYSVVDGGVRESYGVGLVENPAGLWRLLDAFPPGLKSIHKIPPRALGLIALKFDLKAFDERFREVVGELLPGVEAEARKAWVGALMEVGINYDTELLPAFGDERALAFFPSSGFVPGMLLGADLRDARAFSVLMSKLNAALAPQGFPLKETDEGWRINLPMPAEIRIHEGHLLASTNPAILRRTIASWESPEKTLAKDGEIFARVMKGLNGGDTGSLIALAYGDIRHWLPPLMVIGATTGALDGGPFNPRPMPDVQKLAGHFTGFAIGVRRDKEGLAVESFGPVGMSALTIPAFFYTRAAAAQVRVARAR